MTPDIVTFRAVFPEYASVADPTVQVYLEDAADTLDLASWGSCYGKAVLYYAAHHLALAQARAASASVQEGAVVVPQTRKLQSGTQAGISFSFEQSMAQGMSDQWLSQSPYGQAFAALRRQCLAPAFLAW